MAAPMTDHVLLSAEAKFAQKLAGNEKVVRDRATRKLKKWMIAKCASKTGFTTTDFVNIWKGLHYCMWMSDKPLIQEELANTIASLIHCFDKSPDQALTYFAIHMRTLAREWGLLDKWRVNKFMMLVRRCFHQGLVFLKNHDWSPELADKFATAFYDELISPDVADPCAEGLKLHYVDLFIDELNLVGRDEVPSDILQKLLEPFCRAMMNAQSDTLLRHIKDNIFMCILGESAKMEFEDEIEQDINDADEAADIFRLKFDIGALGEHLFKMLSQEKSKSKSRRFVYHIVTQCRKFVDGTFGQPKERPEKSKPETLSEKDYDDALEKLVKLDKKLHKFGNRKRKKPGNSGERYVTISTEEPNKDEPVIMEKVLMTKHEIKKLKLDEKNKKAELATKVRGNKFKDGAKNTKNTKVFNTKFEKSVMKSEKSDNNSDKSAVKGGAKGEVIKDVKNDVKIANSMKNASTKSDATAKKTTDDKSKMKNTHDKITAKNESSENLLKIDDIKHVSKNTDGSGLEKVKLKRKLDSSLEDKLSGSKKRKILGDRPEKKFDKIKADDHDHKDRKEIKSDQKRMVLKDRNGSDAHVGRRRSLQIRNQSSIVGDELENSVVRTSAGKFSVVDCLESNSKVANLKDGIESSKLGVKIGGDDFNSSNSKSDNVDDVKIDSSMSCKSDKKIDVPKVETGTENLNVSKNDKIKLKLNKNTNKNVNTPTTDAKENSTVKKLFDESISWDNKTDDQKNEKALKVNKHTPKKNENKTPDLNLSPIVSEGNIERKSESAPNFDTPNKSDSAKKSKAADKSQKSTKKSAKSDETEKSTPKSADKSTGRKSPTQPATSTPIVDAVARFKSSLTSPSIQELRAMTPVRPVNVTPKGKAGKAGSTRKIPTAMSTPLSAKKRVSFGMHRNTSLDFEDSINFSPGLPFNPKRNPNQSILKATPTRRSPIRPFRTSPKKSPKKTVRRSTAADFF